MQYLGIEYQMKHEPKLDPTFIPFGVWRAAYLKDAKQPIAIAVERDNGQVSVHKTFIHGTIPFIQLCEIPKRYPLAALFTVEPRAVCRQYRKKTCKAVECGYED